MEKTREEIIAEAIELDNRRLERIHNLKKVIDRQARTIATYQAEIRNLKNQMLSRKR